MLAVFIINLVGALTFLAFFKTLQAGFFVGFHFEPGDLGAASELAESLSVLASLLVVKSVLVSVAFEACRFIFNRDTLRHGTFESFVVKLLFKDTVKLHIVRVLATEWTFVLIFLPFTNAISTVGCPTLVTFLWIKNDFQADQAFKMPIFIFILGK